MYVYDANIGFAAPSNSDLERVIIDEIFLLTPRNWRINLALCLAKTELVIICSRQMLQSQNDAAIHAHENKRTKQKA